MKRKKKVRHRIEQKTALRKAGRRRLFLAFRKRARRLHEQSVSTDE